MSDVASKNYMLVNIRCSAEHHIKHSDKVVDVTVKRSEDSEFVTETYIVKSIKKNKNIKGAN